MMSPQGSILETMPGVAVRMALEKATASLIAYDVVTARSLQKLDGKILQVNSVTPAIALFVRFGEKPEFLAACEQEADCVLSGSAVSLLRLALSDAPMAFLQQEDIVLSGDSGLLIAASAIIREADIDWEQMISQYTGGVLAHFMGAAFRQGDMAARGVHRTVVSNLPEYLQEELRLLPPSGQTEAFYADLSDLRLATDRLQARIEHLENMRKKSVQGGGL
ncbi:SCP2 sterol-binding domain-containing protein [Parendozoicomonas sp. Alg238-R29]|uniref:ubiquinone biosynthesis accessory factor UbiJ n=1 Tax=Parendozoicomonas sp. Alg238-R29 TaxID=2993446 RepID=UPI00248F0FD0|nr:SCP2 sterol-binding domain-containing protein [Parendozoicomonas sp. Alg238-R29]